MATSTKKTKKAKSLTMADLLAEMGDNIVIPKKHQTVKGTVLKREDDALYLDIGAKSEGIVNDREFTLAQDYIETLKPGDQVEVTILADEVERGRVPLSLRRSATNSKWEFFEKAMEDETELEALGLEVNKGGLIASVENIRGFVPSSQFGKNLVGHFDTLKGKKFKVRVIEVDAEKNRLIFSERHVSEAKELALKEKALEQVKPGGIYDGVVSGVMHFGLFVTVEVPVDKKGTLGHVEGLVHISEISWEKVAHPKDYHKVGDRIKVKVLDVDENTGKLNLSIKQLKDDPWLTIDERYQPGTTVTGVVSRVENFGVFINVEPGVDGLIHASKLDSAKTFKKGDKISVNVESVSADQRRMSLSPVLTERPVEYR
jgi:ribosomal protein S1